jgi:hypothetical protein
MKNLYIFVQASGFDMVSCTNLWFERRFCEKPRKTLKNDQFWVLERFEPDSSRMPISRDVQTALFE